MCLTLLLFCGLLPPLSPSQLLPQPKERLTAHRAGTARRKPRWQTPFPSKFQPRPLEHRYWTSRQLDSLAAPAHPAPGQFLFFLSPPPDPYTNRRRSRCFCRVAGPLGEWVELDFVHPTRLGPPETVESAISPVHFKPGGPPELLVEWYDDGGGSGNRFLRVYTQLITLDGPPTLVWESADKCEETSHNAASAEEYWSSREYIGRSVAVRRGLVYVSRLTYHYTQTQGETEVSNVSFRRSYIFPTPYNQVNRVTQITPGRYRYRNGRFWRVP